MLEITLNEDGSLVVTSNDRQGENATVADALENAGRQVAADRWNDAPFLDDVLSVTFPADEARGVLLALEDDWPDKVEGPLDQLSPPHVGGGPKTPH